MNNTKKADFLIWLDFANEDMKAAESLLEDGIFNTVCFHSQQAAEKCLKTLILKNEGKVPKTHDLLFLCQKVIKYEPGMTNFSDELVFLNRFYTPTRYPDILIGSLPESQPSKVDARKAVKFAEEIFIFSKNSVNR